MPKFKDKNSNLDLISSKLNLYKESIVDNKYGYDIFAYTDLTSLLKSMIDFNPEITGYEQYRIIRKSLNIVSKKGEITGKKLWSEICKQCRLYFNEEENTYKLLTNISLSQACQIPTIRYNGSTIVFNPKLNKKLTRRNKISILSSSFSLNSKFPNKYTNLSVTINARSFEEAYHKSIDNLDFIRGILNYKINTINGLINTDLKSPINRLILGPIHSCFYNDISKLDESYINDNVALFHGSIRPCNILQISPEILDYLDIFRKILSKSKYEVDLRNIVISYARALDIFDYDVAFIRLWSLLEHLTHTLKEKYDETIKRVSNLFEDKEYHRQILSTIRNTRNINVHFHNSSSDSMMLIDKLKHYVEELIYFHVFNEMKFASIKEAGEFMEILSKPVDKQLKLYQLAKEFLSKD